MTDDKLKELIKPIEPLNGSTSNKGVFRTEEVQQQTENLRKAVKALIEAENAIFSNDTTLKCSVQKMVTDTIEIIIH